MSTPSSMTSPASRRRSSPPSWSAAQASRILTARQRTIRALTAPTLAVLRGAEFLSRQAEQPLDEVLRLPEPALLRRIAEAQYAVIADLARPVYRMRLGPERSAALSDLDRGSYWERYAAALVRTWDRRP